ncbi:iron ABC transporter permease [Desulfovibrio sp. OttesenSCG-928-C06]|nr:iron ABC transporter permease [Desulfovibrio sp. OttesenSCG-928-C06]
MFWCICTFTVVPTHSQHKCDPYILGASSGAACGAALAIIFPYIFPQGQLAAFICALAAVLLSYGLVRSRGQIPPMALVLSGIIVGALFSAMVGIMKYLAADTQLREITFWMMGGLHYATWADAALAMGAVLPIFLLLWRFGWQLNILSLGDEEARSLGLNPASARLLIIIAATFMSAICVSICGIIAWVGLMMPHAARMLFGPDHRWVIPGSALLGAIYLLFCDTIARTLIDSEIPLGIVTSVIGAPYLLWLLRSRGRAVYGL